MVLAPSSVKDRDHVIWMKLHLLRYKRDFSSITCIRYALISKGEAPKLQLAFAFRCTHAAKSFSKGHLRDVVAQLPVITTVGGSF